MNPDQLLERFGRETIPSAAALQAVEEDLVRQGMPLGRGRLVLPRTRRPRRWIAVGALALAAVGVLVVALDRPESPVPVHLESGEWQRLEIDAAVQFAYQGLGEVYGHADHTEITWESGTLWVEIEQDRGLELVVTTREARTRVVGTAFEVVRDARGTTVRVERGAVELTCHRGNPVRLVLGDERTCGPVSAASLLGLALDLRDAGVEPERVLATVEEGMGLTAEGSLVHGELRVVRLRALADLGRTEEALLEAEAFLEDGAGVRRTQVDAFIEELESELEDEAE